MSSKTGRRVIAIWATGVGAGLLTVAAPVHAAPACAQYGFPGEVQIFEGDPAYAIRTTFSSTGPTASGPADRKDTSGKASTGTISGDIKGRKINLVYTSDAGAKNFLAGDVGDDGIGRGLADVIDGTNRPWSSVGQFTCLDGATTPNDGTAEVTGDVDMYDSPGGTGMKYPGWLEGGEGQRVPLITCHDDNWCNVIAPDGRAVWVWGKFIKR
jgi:hypothetical protein